MGHAGIKEKDIIIPKRGENGSSSISSTNLQRCVYLLFARYKENLGDVSTVVGFKSQQC
jgi:hypothetical protein